MKKCACGAQMDVRLRTIIYTRSSSVSIRNVPVLSCANCEKSEVYPSVKDELKSLLREWERDPVCSQFGFHERNEFARLLVQATQLDERHVSMDHLIEERINQLLDVLLLSQSLHDKEWVKDTERRLQQIIDQACFH